MGEGVSLASIETRQENWELKKWLLKHGDQQTGAWLGGSANGHHDRWSWFPTGQLIRWYDWGPSQPSGSDQHCLYIVGGFLGYQWADFHCDFEMTFLCEYKVNRASPWVQTKQNKMGKKKKDSLTKPAPLFPPNHYDKTIADTKDIIRKIEKEMTNNAVSQEDKKSKEKKKSTPLKNMFSNTDYNRPFGENRDIDEETDTDIPGNTAAAQADVKTKIDGKDNSIEVIASKDSSVILFKKDAFKRTEKVAGDNVSWSILEMLKNVIKMPFQKAIK